MLKQALLALPAIALALGACTADPTPTGQAEQEQAERGKIGKADLWGSCDSHCGGISDGTCYCDDLCEDIGDCCDDYADACLAGDDCPDPEDPNVSYASQDPQTCTVIFFVCEPGFEYFGGECGCGCIKSDAEPVSCNDISDPDACNATDGCSYLVPGCGTPALPSVGCYETCSDDDACDSGTCSTAVMNPCAGSMCLACGAEVDVCL